MTHRGRAPLQRALATPLGGALPNTTQALGVKQAPVRKGPEFESSKAARTKRPEQSEPAAPQGKSSRRRAAARSGAEVQGMAGSGQ